MYHKTPDLGSLSKFKLNAYKEKNIFRSTSVWASILLEQFQTRSDFEIRHRKIYLIPSKIRGSIPTFKDMCVHCMYDM